MLFSEIYSTYYITVAEIISTALRTPVDIKTINEIANKHAFAESSISISQALKNARWPFIKSDGTSVIKTPVKTPMSTLEKRWLKSLLDDDRIRLFDVDVSGLEDVKPLYKKDVFVKFDMHTDSDPYKDDTYIENFRAVYKALISHKKVVINFTDKRGFTHENEYTVENIEYSMKNDKFRILAVCDDRRHTVNMSSVNFCVVTENDADTDSENIEREKKQLVATLVDENNALQRFLISFSYHEKETSKLSDTHYQVKLSYFSEDETEILIQILSFSNSIKVLSPNDFVEKLRCRVEKQMLLLGQN